MDYIIKNVKYGQKQKQERKNHTQIILNMLFFVPHKINKLNIFFYLKQ